MITAFKQYLSILKLGSVSRKLYFSDVQKFLRWSTIPSVVEGPTLDKLSSPSTYTKYLDSLRASATAPSMLKRTTASLRQFGQFLATTYSVPNPVSLHRPSTIDHRPLFGDYIKHFINYLNTEHLSPLTIKSYKSDVTRYLHWTSNALLGTELAEVLRNKNTKKYLNHLSEGGNTLPSTIDRKGQSLTRFQAWYTTIYAPSNISDNIALASDQPREFRTLRQRVFGTSATVAAPDISPNPVKTPNSRISLVPNLASASVRNFATLLILLLFTATLAVFGYRQFSRDVRLTAAYPSTPVTPNRQLSFQGRLENAGGTPITTATDFVFKLFTASSGGTELYSSGTCSIDPDADGVFNTQIGSTCGSGIASSVFTENAGVWLEVTVGAETLDPRQQIATVAYALNSETIQGFPLSSTVSAIKNTVVPMNQWGEIIVGEQSPRLKGVSGTFEISAPALSFITTTGSNGNISFAPDGTGQINATGNTTSTNFFNVSNAQLTTGSLLTGTAANNNSGFKLIDLLSGSSPTSKFSVTDAGNVTLAGDLTVSGTNATLPNNSLSPNEIFTTGQTDEYCLTYESTGSTWEWQTCGAGGGGSSNWRSSLGSLSPLNDTWDLLVGGIATSSAKAGFINIGSGTPTATVSAGTAGGAYLTATGHLVTTARQSLTLGNSATYDTTGNILLNPSGTGNVGIGVTNPTSKLQIGGSTSTISNSSGDLTIDSFTGNVVFGTDDDLIPTLGAGSADLGSVSLPWDNLYVSNVSYGAAGSITLTDNTANAFQIKEGANVYLDITTTNDAETFTLNLPIGGATSHTANLFNANIAQTINIGTGTAIDTINIGTGGTSADDINLGGLPTSHVDVTGIVNFAGGTTYYVDASGNAKFLDLQVADTGNPGLTVGNGTIGFVKIGGSTISDNSGNLTLDSDSAAITFAADDTTLTASGIATIDMAATVAWDVATLNTSSLATINATSLATVDTAAALLLSTTTLTLDSNSTINGGSGANDDLTLQGTSNATRTTSYVLLQPTAGNVGIGTSAPGKTLSVDGDIELSSATGKLYDTFVTAGISLGATNETALVGYGATSLVGALNELKNSSKNTGHNDYLSWANHYQARGEGSNLTDSEALNGLFFDTFADSTKIDATGSTSSGAIRVGDNSYRVGLNGGQTMSTAQTDNDGQTYLGSNTVNDIYYYDRTRDSSPDVLVELGIDPNWYNGVTLSVATGSAQYSQNGTIADKNPNLTTSYNGSLIKATGTDTTPRTIFITIKSPTIFDWTNYQGDSATGVTITPGTAQTLGSTGVSATFTSTNYNVGDVFKIASWFIEAEGTTRGAKQQFPERSYITAEGTAGAGYVGIVDADTQKLWMRFSEGTGYYVRSTANRTPQSVHMLNSKLYFGQKDSSNGIFERINFDTDSLHLWITTAKYTYDQGISQRNTASNLITLNSTETIVANDVNDVAAAVIPNQPTQEVTVSGWGYVQGDGATLTLSETVQLPYKFNSPPNIVANSAGYKTNPAPTSLSVCGGGAGGINAGPGSTSTNSFTVQLRHNNNTTIFGSTEWLCYTWTATGTVSPKQFVAVATGNSTSGGTDVINETDGTVAHIMSNAGVAYSGLWQNKIALGKNELYHGHSSAGGNVSTLGVYHGVHGLATESSGSIYRHGLYGVGYVSTFAPVILGAATGTAQITSLSVTPNTSNINDFSNTIYVGTATGLSIIQENQGSGNAADGTEESSSSVKYYTKDYISEEMVGDIRGMWPLNNANASSDFEDVSIKANTLTGTNITAAGDSVSGVRGTATDFDGSTEYLSRADDADFDFSTNFSSSFWIKTTDTDATIFNKLQAGVEQKYVNFSSGKVGFYLYNVMGGAPLTGNRDINDNQWHHVATTYDGSTAKIYIDGTLDNSKSATGDIGDGTGVLYIGQSGSGTSYFAGYLDELMLTATTLTEGQIKNMYQVGYRALQSHGTGLGGGAADTNQQLQYASTGTNTVGVVAPDFNNQYMYVGLNSTTLGGLTKIQLNSDTAVKKYIASGNTPTGGTAIIDEDVTSLAVGYQLEAVGSAASGAKTMGYDNNADNIRTTLYSKPQTLASSTKFAYLWASLYKDSSDLDSNIIIYGCNAYATAALCTSNAAWVAGTSIQVDSTMSPPEQEYNFAFPSAGSNMIFKFDFYRDASNDKANTYLTRYGATWASSVGGADIAERYHSVEPAYPGDIVTIVSPPQGGDAAVGLSKVGYDAKAIGVVTTNPGIVMDENLVDLNWNAASRNSPDRPAVALAGRVPVKVSNMNGNILVGDSITSSSIPGVGMKATQSGTVIGKALESFTCDSPTTNYQLPTTNCTGTVMTFVNIGHYEPTFYLSDLGDFIFTRSVSSTDSATLANQNFKLVRILAGGAQEVIDRIGTFGNLIAESIKGQNLAIDTISPLATGTAITVSGPVIIHQPSTIDHSPDLPTLVVEGTIETATVSARTAKLDTLEVKNIIAERITVNQIDGLEARIATLSAGTTTEISDAQMDSITDRIKARLATLTDSPTAQDLPVPQESLDSQTPSEAMGEVGQYTATTSATLASADIDFATINNYLAVIGTATITELDVTGNLFTNSINSKSGLLALGENTLLIDSSGQVMINGDLTVSGSILADSAGFNTLELGTPSSATPSALGQLLAIYDESGTAVATINASGSANLASLTTGMITIASAGNATSSSLLASSISSNATAGESVLVAPNTQLTIESPYVTPNSLVYLTPTGNTDNKVLFVQSKESCLPPTASYQLPTTNCKASFTVGIDTPATSDISFNWWIIELAPPKETGL